MKLLLDECVDVHLRPHIAGHDAYTVAFMGWSGISNGRLLALAAANHFDALVTTDHNVEHQQNLAALPLALVVLDAPSNDIDDLLPLIPNLLAVLSALKPRTVVRVKS